MEQMQQDVKSLHEKINAVYGKDVKKSYKIGRFEL